LSGARTALIEEAKTKVNWPLDFALLNHPALSRAFHAKRRALPALGMFGDPLGGLLFGGETLDYFGLAIGPNIDHPPNPGLPFRVTKADRIRTSREYAPTARRFKPVA
jgi:hypothetical protein